MVEDPDWFLRARPANVAPGEQNDYSKWMTLQATSKGDKTRTFVLPVRPEWCDPIYAKVSSWAFMLDNGQAESMLVHDAQKGAIMFNLTVTAQKSGAAGA